MDESILMESCLPFIKKTENQSFRGLFSNPCNLAGASGLLLASFRRTFFHPDFTVGSGNSPDHAARSALLVGFTTDRELRTISLMHSPCPEGYLFFQIIAGIEIQVNTRSTQAG